jgi:ankyrin repeat protein
MHMRLMSWVLTLGFFVPADALARISHQVSAASVEPGIYTAFRSVGLLDVLSSRPAESFRRAPCIHARLRRLATNPGEKCGLALQGKAPQARKIDQQLLAAVEKGSPDAVANLIAQGADANMRNETGETPLRRATNRKVAELLIAKGADINARDGEFKMSPIFNANLEVTELLVSKGADKNARAKHAADMFPAMATPLDVAERMKMVNVVAYLRSQGGERASEIK